MIEKVLLDGGRVLVTHKKRGTSYRVLGLATLQADHFLTDGTEVVVYQAMKSPREVWVRETAELCDGRFKIRRMSWWETPVSSLWAVTLVLCTISFWLGRLW